MDKFSERLVALRKEKDLTQASLPASVASSALRSPATRPRAKSQILPALQMADYFGVTTDYLLGREDERAHGNEASFRTMQTSSADMTPSRKSSAPSSPRRSIRSMCCSPGA